RHTRFSRDWSSDVCSPDLGFPPVNANQQHSIAQQLDDGIRVLLIDVYPDEADPDAVLMCHGPCSLASTPHLQGLTAITEFLLAQIGRAPPSERRWLMHHAR